MESSLRSCGKCHRSQADISLKRCAKCVNQWYCGRDCQRADWKTHKAICISPQQTDTQKPGQTTTYFNAVPNVVGDIFKSICPDDYLHHLSEKNAFGQLIDCYRMRVEDDYVFAGDTRGLYNDDDPLLDFRKFLGMAETRVGVLPGWWSVKKRRECEKRAVNSARWDCLYYAVQKQDVIEHYGDPTMPMRLRLLAEKIYCTKIAGT